MYSNKYSPSVKKSCLELNIHAAPGVQPESIQIPSSVHIVSGPYPPSHTRFYCTVLYDLRKVLVAAAQGHDMIINCLLLDPKGDMIVTAVHILKLERYRED